MPVLIDRASLGCTILTGMESVRPPRRHPSGCEWIEVGLVNNMPDAALESTEQQFLDLLAAAAGESWAISGNPILTPPTSAPPISTV